MRERISLHIENLCFEAIIGVLDSERITPQNLLLEARIVYVYDEEFLDFLDYAEICAFLQSHIQAARYELLESALCGCAQALKARYERIEELFLLLKKPSILAPAIVGASLTRRYGAPIL